MCFFRNGKITPNYNNNRIEADTDEPPPPNSQESTGPEDPPVVNEHPRYSDAERKDGRSETDPDPDLEDPDCGYDQPWRGMLRKTDSKINVNE